LQIPQCFTILYIINNRPYDYKGEILQKDGKIEFTIDVSVPNAKEIILVINEIPMVAFKIK